MNASGAVLNLEKSLKLGNVTKERRDEEDSPGRVWPADHVADQRRGASWSRLLIACLKLMQDG
jgi:hypothetical protein